MSQVIDLEKARRLQIGRRHNRTFINFYKAVKDVTRDPALYEKGVAETFCTSNYRQGFKHFDEWGSNVPTKHTKSFRIRFYAGNVTLIVKEPGK